MTSFDNKSKDTALRVAARFQDKQARDGKFVGKDCRLQWSNHQWLLEELPQKGKRKLRVAKLVNQFSVLNANYRGAVPLMPFNVLQDAKLSRSDSYDAIKKKILKASEDALKEAGDGIPEYAHKDRPKWYEQQVYFLEVTPEDVPPFTAKGKDFMVSIEWAKWSAYKPMTDAEKMHAYQGDPSQSSISSKSKGSARKMYKTLQADPDALKNVTWRDFSSWLDTKKMGYEYNHTVWR